MTFQKNKKKKQLHNSNKNKHNPKNALELFVTYAVPILFSFSIPEYFFAKCSKFLPEPGQKYLNYEL